MLLEGRIMGLLKFCLDCLQCKDLQEPEEVPEGPTRIPDYIRCPKSWRCNFVPPPPPPPSLDLEDEQQSGSEQVIKGRCNQEVIMSRVFAEMISHCYQNWCRRFSWCFRSEETESEGRPSSTRGVGTMTSPFSLPSLTTSPDGATSPAQILEFQEGNLRSLPAPIPMISVPVDVHSGPITGQPGHFQSPIGVGGSAQVPGLSSSIIRPSVTIALPVQVGTQTQTHLNELQVGILPNPILISPPQGFNEETSSSADEIELELPLFLGHYRPRVSNEPFHESFKF